MNNQSNNPIHNPPADWGWGPVEQPPRLIDPGVLLNQGAALLGGGFFNEAADCFRGALALNPNQLAEGNEVAVRAGYGLGWALLASGQFAPAADALENVLVVAPGHLEAIDALYEAYRHTQMEEQAIGNIMHRLKSLLQEQPDTDGLLKLAVRMCQTLSILDFERRPEMEGRQCNRFSVKISTRLHRDEYFSPSG